MSDNKDQQSKTDAPALILVSDNEKEKTKVAARIVPAVIDDRDTIIECLDILMERCDEAMNTDEPMIGVAVIGLYKGGACTTAWSDGAPKHLPSLLGGLKILETRLAKAYVETDVPAYEEDYDDPDAY